MTVSQSKFHSEGNCCTVHTTLLWKEIADMLLVILMYILVLAGFAQIDKLGVSEDHSCEISRHSTTTMINRDYS